MIPSLYLAQMRWNRSIYRSIIITNGTQLASNWPSKVCQKQNIALLALFSRCIVSKVCGTLGLWQTWRERSWLCHVSFQGKILILCKNEQWLHFYTKSKFVVTDERLTCITFITCITCITCITSNTFIPSINHISHINCVTSNESSINNSKELSSSIFQSLSVCESVTWPDLPFFQYTMNKGKNALLTQSHQLPRGTASYWLSTNNCIAVLYGPST